MAANPDSILDSVKKTIGIDSEDGSFNLDIMLFINSTIGSLRQLGISPDSYVIVSDSTALWSQYVPDARLQGMVKSYVAMKVKLSFDPPEGRATLPAAEKMLEELAWRINSEAEAITPPSNPFTAQTTTQITPEAGVTKAFFAPTVVHLVFASSVTVDASKGNVFYLAMTGDCTIPAPVNGVDGEHITLEVISNGHSVSWGSGWDFGDGGVPSLSSGGKADIISAYYSTSAAKWRAGFSTGF